jgi:hypothetical protein
MSCTFRHWNWFRISSARAVVPSQRVGFRLSGLAGVGLLCLMSQAALAVTSGDLALARTFNKTVAMTNSPILVMATLTNTSPNTLRGFCYFDQTLTGLTVATVSVTLGGRSLTNFSLESGLNGDVYAGCTPRRWWLENPTNFLEANPLPPQGVVQIVFSISCASTGTFSLQQFGCAACKSDKTNTLYGFSGAADQQTVSFVSGAPASNTPPMLPAQTNRNLLGPQGLTVTNTATDNDLPVNPLRYALQGPVGASIDTVGVIRWQPTAVQIPSTNLFTTVVTDTNSWAVNARELSATNSFSVVARAAATAPEITLLYCSNQVAVITWASSAGSRYRVQHVDNLTDTNWSDLQPDITATGPSAAATDAIGLLPQRFYRILLVVP